MRTIFDDWKEETQALADLFVKKMGYEKDECCWLEDKIGGTLCCENQHFFNLACIVEFFNYDATAEQFNKYCDYRQENLEIEGKDVPQFNLKGWLKLKGNNNV